MSVARLESALHAMPLFTASRSEVVARIGFGVFVGRRQLIAPLLVWPAIVNLAIIGFDVIRHPVNGGQGIILEVAFTPAFWFGVVEARPWVAGLANSPDRQSEPLTE